jgi:hypothetical protein
MRSGRFLWHLRKIRPDLALTGVDLAANRVSLAVIEHVADIRAFVDRLWQLAKPAGTVTIVTLNEDSLLYGLARLGKRWGVPLAFNRLYSRHHLHHFTRKSLRTVLQAGGLQIESEIVHNAPLAAIDIPVKSRTAEAVLRSGMWMVRKAVKQPDDPTSDDLLQETRVTRRIRRIGQPRCRPVCHECCSV